MSVKRGQLASKATKKPSFPIQRNRSMCQTVPSSREISLEMPRSQCLLSVTLSVSLPPLTQIPMATLCLQIPLKGLQSSTCSWITKRFKDESYIYTTHRYICNIILFLSLFSQFTVWFFFFSLCKKCPVRRRKRSSVKDLVVWLQIETNTLPHPSLRWQQINGRNAKGCH